MQINSYEFGYLAFLFFLRFNKKKRAFNQFIMKNYISKIIYYLILHVCSRAFTCACRAWTVSLISCTALLISSNFSSVTAQEQVPVSPVSPTSPWKMKNIVKWISCGRLCRLDQAHSTQNQRSASQSNDIVPHLAGCWLRPTGSKLTPLKSQRNCSRKKPIPWDKFLRCTIIFIFTLVYSCQLMWTVFGKIKRLANNNSL